MKKQIQFLIIAGLMSQAGHATKAPASEPGKDVKTKADDKTADDSDIKSLKLELMARVHTIKKSLPQIQAQTIQDKATLSQLNARLDMMAQEIGRADQKPMLLALSKTLDTMGREAQDLRKKNVRREESIEADKKKEVLAPSTVFATNTLLIFLDNSEIKFGAITDPFLEALQQKVGPILVSNYLFFNVFARNSLNTLYLREQESIRQGTLTKDAAEYSPIKERYNLVLQTFTKLMREQPVLDQKNKQAIVDQLNKSLPSFELHPSLDVYKALQVEKVEFKPSEWIIKRIGYDLRLLIPRNSPFLDTYHSLSKKLTDKDPLTSIELRLGLKIDHMTSSTSDSMKSLEGKWDKEEVEMIDNEDYFIDSLNSLFITRAEYSKYKVPVIDIPRWAIYITGHGSKNSTIVSLPIDQFKSFLDFLENKLVTRLLVYSSCFDVGENSTAVYQELVGASENKNRPYSYAIAVEGVADSTVGVASSTIGLTDLKLRDLDFVRKKISIVPSVHFDEFIRIVTHANVINYGEVLSLIMQSTKEVSDIPHVRLPGLPWFTVLDVNDHIISIGSILAKTRNKELSVKDFFTASRKKRGAQLEGILLYTPIIPFNLIIDTENVPKMISMLPGRSFHHFKKIVVQNNASLQNFFNAFYPDALLQSEKIFWIDQLQVAEQNVNFISDRLSKINDVIVMIMYDESLKKNIAEIFFTVDGQDYMFNLDTGWANYYYNEFPYFGSSLSVLDLKKKKIKFDMETVVKQFEHEHIAVQKISEVQKKKAQEIEAQKKQDSKTKLDIKKGNESKK